MSGRVGHPEYYWNDTENELSDVEKEKARKAKKRREGAEELERYRERRDDDDDDKDDKHQGGRGGGKERRDVNLVSRREGGGSSSSWQTGSYSGGYSGEWKSRACSLREHLLIKGMAEKPSFNMHVINDHTPFRGDCKVCLQGGLRARQHRRSRDPAEEVLSVDVAGRFTRSTRGRNCFLMAAYTYREKGYTKQRKVKEEEIEEGEAEANNGDGGIWFEEEVDEEQRKDQEEVPTDAEEEQVESEGENLKAPKRVNIVEESDGEEERQARLVLRSVRVKIEPGEKVKQK